MNEDEERAMLPTTGRLVRERMAQAWDEGWNACASYLLLNEDEPNNPYR